MYREGKNVFHSQEKKTIETNSEILERTDQDFKTSILKGLENFKKNMVTMNKQMGNINRDM